VFSYLFSAVGLRKMPSPAGEGWDEGAVIMLFSLFISPSPDPLPLERALKSAALTYLLTLFFF